MVFFLLVRELVVDDLWESKGRSVIDVFAIQMLWSKLTSYEGPRLLGTLTVQALRAKRMEREWRIPATIRERSYLLLRDHRTFHSGMRKELGVDSEGTEPKK